MTTEAEMGPPIGPLDGPTTIETIIRDVFAVDAEMPPAIATALIRLADCEQARIQAGAILARMRRIRQLDPTRIKFAGASQPLRVLDVYPDWQGAFRSQHSSLSEARAC